jgi:predicted nucleic acid-binding protein
MAKKLKVYLDTNMIFGFFKIMLEVIFERRRYREVRRLSALERSSELLEVYTSFFTLIEVIEQIRKWSQKKRKALTTAQIRALLSSFQEIFNIRIVSSVFITQRVLEYVLNNMEWEDAIQLEIARINGFTLVTEDIDLKRLGRRFYPKIINFNELIKRLNSGHMIE